MTKQLTVGTRVWHGANMATDEATGTVTNVMLDRGAAYYRIAWDQEEGRPARRDMIVPACAFDNGPAKFWTVEERNAHRAAEFARFYPTRKAS